MQFGGGAEGCLANNAWRQTKPSCVPRLEGNTEEAHRWGNRTINVGGTWNAPAPQFTDSSATDRLAPPAGYTMIYDAAGNLTYDNYSGSGTRAYDGENRLTSAQDFFGQTSTYACDGDGKRARRAVACGGAVWQVYGALSQEWPLSYSSPPVHPLILWESYS